MSVVAPAAFNVKNVTFSAVKTLDSGGRQAYLNYDSRPLVMQVGPLETPFGLSVFDKIPGAPPKYTVDLKLRGYDDPANNPKVATIYNALHALDEFMLDQGEKNSKAWFKGEKSRAVLAELYTPTIKFAKDAEGNLKPYPPTVKLQLRQKDGKFEAQVFDDKKRPMTDVPLEDILVKGMVGTYLIQCTGVWFAGGKFGLSWKTLQIRADRVPESIRGFAFLDEDGAPSSATAPPAPSARAAPSQNSFAALHDDEEVDDEAALAPPAAAAAAAPVVQPPAVEEDDAEDAPPVPVPAKKTLVTKKKMVIPAKK